MEVSGNFRLFQVFVRNYRRPGVSYAGPSVRSMRKERSNFRWGDDLTVVYPLHQVLGHLHSGLVGNND